MTKNLNFLLRQNFKRAVFFHTLEFLQTRDALLNRLEVRQHAAEPALIDIKLPRTRRFLANRILCLLLRTDKENALSCCCNAAKKIIRCIDLADGLLQVDDVDAVALREDVTSHLRIPTTGLMSKVDTCFE